MSKVSIIILNWNSYEVSRDCLLSLRKIEYRSYEIIVVDNGSVDGSEAKLAAEFPEIRLIRNVRNLGFAGGNNVAICDALARGADYLLLLNNDTVVDPHFLSELINVANRNPHVGLLNPKIYYFDPPDRIWYAGGIHKPWWSCPKQIGNRRRDNGTYNGLREVSFVTGCAFLIKADVVRQIGLLDELFFLSFEDTDWSLRALSKGFKALYVPTSVVWHKDSYVTKKAFGKAVRDYYHARNSILLGRKHMKLPYWPLFIISFTKWTVYHTLGYILKGQPHRIKAFYQGIWSGCSTALNRRESSNSDYQRAL